MRDALKNLARIAADRFGASYLLGRGARRVRKLMPAVTLHSLNSDWDNVLVLAPHPDDEVFGACLLLGKLQEQGKRVTIAYATKGDAYSADAGDRQKEAHISAHRLGAQAVFLNSQDGQLQNTPGLEDKVAALVGQIQPQAIVLPWFGDYHPDHRALARAAIRRPFPQAQYLFYATFSPLWPSQEIKLSFLMGGEEKLLLALEGYRASVNQETINAFLVLRRALAGAYINNSTFWEPYLGIAGDRLERIGSLAGEWPRVYPTLQKSRHWRSFLQELSQLASAFAE